MAKKRKSTATKKASRKSANSKRTAKRAKPAPPPAYEERQVEPTPPSPEPAAPALATQSPARTVEPMTAPSTPEPSAPAPAPSQPDPAPVPQFIPTPLEPSPAPSAPPPPAPAPAPAAPQWVPIPADAPATVEQPTPQEDTGIVLATTRRGLPWATALGTLLATLGLLVIIATYYYGLRYGRLPQPAGIRADYVGALLLLLGLLLAVTFLFVPSRRGYGLAGGASRDDLQEELRASTNRLRTTQTFVGIGLALVALGLFWTLWWMYVGYRAGAARSTLLAGYAIPTHYLGALLVLVGLLTAFYFWGGVVGARRRQNLAAVALHQAAAPPPPASPATLPNGVTEEEVRNLMRRLDGLMAQLPDAAVTEFSKTPEADTYLKLLGS